MRILFEELWFFLLILLGSLVFSAFAGFPRYFLVVAILFYIVWNGFWFYMTYRWLNNEAELPDTKPWGAWGLLLERLVPRLNAQDGGSEVFNRRTALLNKIVEDLPIGVIVLDEDFIISSTNQAAIDLLGIDLSRDIGYSIIKILRQPNLIRFLRNLEYSTNERHIIEFSPRHNPRITVFLEIIRLVDMGFLMTIYDVTEQRTIDTMRRDFIANISHEIRTPLSVIKGQSELLAESVDREDEMVAKTVNAIENQVGRLTGLSDDLIRLMELESSVGFESEEAVELKSVLNTLFLQLRGLYPTNTTIDLKEVIDVRIKMRHRDVVSIFENLITNAARYVHEPALIKVRTIRFQNDDLRVEFSDNGDGIPPEHLSRVTERFYRVEGARSREEGGTGLGLSIVKHAAQAVGGNISIHSEIGVGTTVTLIFPSSAVEYDDTV